MNLVLEPLFPWTLLALALLAAVLGTTGWSVWRTPPRGWQRWALALTAGTALCWGSAALNPLLLQERGEALRLVIALDVSDSVLRAEGGWQAVRSRTAEALSRATGRLPAQVRATTRADVLTFRDSTAVAAQDIPLSEVDTAVARLTPSDFAVGSGSDLESGLRAAGQRIASSGRSGAVVLVSDGNQTRGDALQGAHDLARQGAPVHVLAVESSAPDFAVAAADLPARVEAGTRTYVRGVLRHFRPGPVEGQLDIRLNPGFEQGHRFGRSLAQHIDIKTEGWVRLRQPLSFQGYGLQFVELSLQGSQGGPPHIRRLFTHVTRPLRVLAVGGDQRWTAAVPQGTFEISRLRPEELAAATDWTGFDAAVLSGVPSERFRPGVLEGLSRAVAEQGLGLMIFNGDHEGSDPEAQSVLMSYAASPLDPLLPVEPGPRPHTPEPPPRHVVIVIDASGSMSGWPMRQAKAIAAHIIVNLLRDVDRLDLITFTSGARYLVSNLRMNGESKQRAMEMVGAIRASGGTDPNRALRLLQERSIEQCGLIFISDGEFGQVSARPDCRATVFAIGRRSVPNDSPLHELADPFPVGPEFDPGGINIPFFDNRPRDRYFEPGRYTPLTVEGESYGLPAPRLPLQGSAVSRRRQGSQVVTLRPKLADPVLAYGPAGEGTVGFFATGFPALWLNDPSGREAVTAWISRVVAYNARNRYHFEIEDLGDALRTTVSLSTESGEIPAVQRLSAQLEFPATSPGGSDAVGSRRDASAGEDTASGTRQDRDGPSPEAGTSSDSAQPPQPLTFQPDSTSPGTFSGVIPNPPGSPARQATLVLRESGPEALERTQRIPILIPESAPATSSLSREAYSYGTNRPLLRAIAEAGGGSVLAQSDRPLLQPAIDGAPPAALWPWLALLGALLYTTAIAVTRWLR
ncbi:MAG TPA: VWA domain-containing protein [Acidobacteriota bacterium]|nr:VWA domain-containing protein [Acidobacteriota bacterium]